MSKFTTIGQKEVYEGAAQLLIANGYDPAMARLTPSAIRTEAAMTTALAAYSFPIVAQQQNAQTVFSTMNLLSLQDVFICSAIALYAADASSSTDGLFNLFSYGNSTAFNTGTSAAQIDQAYDNGYLSLVIDNNQVIPYLPTTLFRRVPFTQQAANIDYTASAINVKDSRDGSEDGIFIMEPNIVMAGNSQFKLSFTLPAALTSVTDGSRWVVVFYGILAQNVSKIANAR